MKTTSFGHGVLFLRRRGQHGQLFPRVDECRNSIYIGMQTVGDRKAMVNRALEHFFGVDMAWNDAESGEASPCIDEAGKLFVYCVQL